MRVSSTAWRAIARCRDLGTEEVDLAQAPVDGLALVVGEALLG
jgi:hypothetical protein